MKMKRNFSEGQAVCFIGERQEKYKHVMPETGTTGRIVLHYEAAGVSLVQWPHGSLASDCDLCRSYMIDADLVPVTEGAQCRI